MAKKPTLPRTNRGERFDFYADVKLRSSVVQYFCGITAPTKQEATRIFKKENKVVKLHWSAGPGEKYGAFLNLPSRPRRR